MDVVLQDEHHISTERPVQKVPGAIAVVGGTLGNLYQRRGSLGGQEWRLKKRLLDFAQVWFPELQVPSRDESSSNGIIKDVLNAKLVKDTGLIVGNAQLFSHFSATLGWQDVTWFYRPVQELRWNQSISYNHPIYIMSLYTISALSEIYHIYIYLKTVH